MPRERTLAPENGSWLPRARTLPESSPPLSTLNTATCSPPTSAHTPVLGTMSSSRQTATSCRLKFFFLGARRPDLAALGDEDHVAVGRVAVHEVAEALEDLWRLDCLLSLALLALDVALQVGFELGGGGHRS